MTVNKNVLRFVLLLFFSIIVMGALVDSNANITCLGGVFCSPTSIEDTGSIGLSTPQPLTLGGAYSKTCAGTDKFSELKTDGTFTCTVDSGSAGSQFLLYHNDADLNLTSTGQCYTYTLPANTYSEILVEAYGNYISDSGLVSGGVWNPTIEFGNVTKERVRSGLVISFGIGLNNAFIPASLKYGQAQTSSTNLDMEVSEVVDGTSFECKAFYVYGVA